MGEDAPVTRSGEGAAAEPSVAAAAVDEAPPPPSPPLPKVTGSTPNALIVFYVCTKLSWHELSLLRNKFVAEESGGG